MKLAEVQKLDLKVYYPSLEEISFKLDEQKERLMIDTLNWARYNYKPDVSLSIAYSKHEIFLKFYITESFFKAEKTDTNQMVCEDSCVEFFVSPEDDGIYYNMEFNAIGTCLMGTGTGRADNKIVRQEIISKIRRFTTAGTVPFKEKKGEFDWAITLAIPVEVFFHHQVTNLKGKKFRANFYKCGEKLTVPHYLTWNPIGTEKPDFHLPQYFGSLKFV